MNIIESVVYATLHHFVLLFPIHFNFDLVIYVHTFSTLTTLYMHVML